MSATLTVRVDDALKTQAEAAFSSMGLTTTGAVTVFLKAVVREQRIPFDVVADPYDADPYFNPANRAVLNRSIAAAKRGEFAETATLDDLETMAQ